MALFKGTPAYVGEPRACRRDDDRGLSGWMRRLLGFPETPRYQPPAPPHEETASLCGPLPPPRR